MTRLVIGSINSLGFLCIRSLLNDNRVIASGVFPYFNQNDVTYPCVTVELAGKENDWMSVDRASKSDSISFDIGCYALSMKQVDELVDDVERILTQNTAKTSSSGLSKLITNQSNPQHPIINGKQTHLKFVNATYKWTGDAK